jgi:uncharacterized protein (TIGR00369 family)
MTTASDSASANPFLAADPAEGARVANGWLHDMPNAIFAKMGIEFVEVSRDRVVARMPVAGNTQPYGLLHGGATGVLCETVASFGTGVIVGLDKVVTGVELNVNHIRGVRDGSVTCTGVPLHIGRTTAVWDMRVEDDRGRLAAVSRLTLVIRDTGGAGGASG